jgi:small conductance mechanosensitive channel
MVELANIENYLSVNYPKLIIVGITAIICIILLKYVNIYLKKIFRKAGFDATLKNFTRRLIMVFLWFVLVTFVLSNLGFNVLSFIAGLSIAGFIIGFATKDILSNFATGVFLLITRHYKVGEEVEVSGIRGKVKSISLSSTIIITDDKQYIIVPNSKVWGGPIKNLSRLKEKK